MASVPAPAPALTVIAVQSVRVAVMATPVIMSASSLLVADMGLQAGAAVVLVGGFRDST
jgi:hypothetical protein